MSTFKMYIIDTSYLLEFLELPARSTPNSAREIKLRLGRAIQSGDRLYVPVPVLFELANFIAQVPHEERRKALARWFAKTVKSSVEEGNPFVLVPVGGRDIMLDLAELLSLCETFARSFAHRQVGLTDTSIIEQAKRLKKNYAGTGCLVHIWTRDKALKRHEPDAEADPYLG